MATTSRTGLPACRAAMPNAVAPRQGRKTTCMEAWPAFRPAGKLKHAPPKSASFHEISRAEGPSQQARRPVLRRGSALLMVLWISAALAAVAFSLANRSEEHTSELQSLRHLVC